MGFKAINERAQSQSTPAGESYEAKESRVVQDYEAALRLLAIGDKHQAMVTSVREISSTAHFDDLNLSRSLPKPSCAEW